MKRDLWKAAAFSLAVHGGVLIPGWSSRPAVVDVERGLVSLDVELLSAAPLPTPEALERIVAPSPRDDAWLQEPVQSPPPSPGLVNDHGATTEATPQAVRNRPPAYPWLARMQGWEGTVVLQVRVEPDGRAGQVTVMNRSGHPALDHTAQQAVSRWEFLPGTRGGRPVESTVKVPVRFRLTEDAPHEP